MPQSERTVEFRTEVLLCISGQTVIDGNILPEELTTDIWVPWGKHIAKKLGQQSAICWNYLGLFREYGLDCIFLEIKRFCFSRKKTETFPHLFEKESCETSQNFNSMRQPIEKMKIKIAWIS